MKRIELGECCPFWAGDIVTSFVLGHEWRGKKVRVEAIDGSRLWGEIIEEGRAASLNESVGLALLRRNGYVFEVGDKVIVQNNKEMKKRANIEITIATVGKIIVINPESGILFPFLAEFEGFSSGYDGILSWAYPWFPNQYKTSCRSRLWINGGGVEKYLP